MLLPIKKDVKSCSKELNDAFKRAEDLLIANLAKAERENATVYLQRIPAFNDLPAIVGAPLVKSITPPDLDASTEGLFTSVIPDTRWAGYDVVALCLWRCLWRHQIAFDQCI